MAETIRILNEVYRLLDLGLPRVILIDHLTALGAHTFTEEGFVLLTIHFSFGAR